MVDMAHIAGLVAAGLHPNPVPVAEFVTTTTHKTLRGPRAGMILCKKDFAKKIDSAIFPGIQGGPLMHVIAAKAVCFKEALNDDFKLYQQQILKNSRTMAKALESKGYRIVAGGTDNHLFMVDLRPKNTKGFEAADVLDKVCITVNKNLIPYDTKSPFVTSGIRIGTPAMTSRGMKENDMDVISGFINRAIISHENEEELIKIKNDVRDFTKSFSLYPEI